MLVRVSAVFELYEGYGNRVQNDENFD